MRELDIICLPCTRSVTVSVDRFHGVREFAFLQRTLFNAIFDAQCIAYVKHTMPIWNESVPKIIINNTINLFLKLKWAFW